MKFQRHFRKNIICLTEDQYPIAWRWIDVSKQWTDTELISIMADIMADSAMVYAGVAGLDPEWSTERITKHVKLTGGRWTTMYWLMLGRSQVKAIKLESDLHWLGSGIKGQAHKLVPASMANRPATGKVAYLVYLLSSQDPQVRQFYRKRR